MSEMAPAFGVQPNTITSRNINEPAGSPKPSVARRADVQFSHQIEPHGQTARQAQQCRAQYLDTKYGDDFMGHPVADSQ